VATPIDKPWSAAGCDIHRVNPPDIDQSKTWLGPKEERRKRRMITAAVFITRSGDGARS
jgi:hypothetical protein